jgi:hypothetical protein
MPDIKHIWRENNFFYGMSASGQVYKATARMSGMDGVQYVWEIAGYDNRSYLPTQLLPLPFKEDKDGEH